MTRPFCGKTKTQPSGCVFVFEFSYSHAALGRVYFIRSS
jgi:hypothetical protein